MGKHMESRAKRRQLFSNPKVQLRIIIFFAVMALLYAGTNCYMMKATLTSISDDLLELPLSPTARHDADVVIRQNEATLDIQLAVFTFISVTVVLMAAVFFSHTIGGPIFSLNRYMRAVAQGDTKPRRLHFRKTDFFGDLADSFNVFQESQKLIPPDDKA